MILSDIEAKLKEIDPNVYYGMVDKRQAEEAVWNYIVFNRSKIRHSTNKTSASDFFEVHIVRENYIPDGLEDEVINKLRELPGIRSTGDDSSFTYTQKPNTNIVMEILTIYFLRGRKSDV